jgi:hypothetical protein
MSLYDQRPCAEFTSWYEIAEDALTALLMSADGVSLADLLALANIASSPPYLQALLPT